MSSRQFAAYDDENRLPYNPYGPSVPISDIAKAAAKAAANPPPAIIQQVEIRNCAWYEKKYGEIEKKSALEKGELLAEFKKSGAWKEKYTRWNDACSELFDISKSHVDKLILKFYEATLAHLEPLAQNAEEKALKQVEKAREEKPATEKAKAEPKPVTDKTGYPVPASLVPVWERRTEIQVLLDELSHVKVQLEEYMKKGDEPMWTHQSLTTLIPDLQNVWRQVKAAMPFAVCSSCRGTKRDSCRHCRGWGFLPEFMWHMVPEEQKARV